MPSLSPTMSEVRATCAAGHTQDRRVLTRPSLCLATLQGTLAKWRKAVGDKIVPGDILAEIQTVCGTWVASASVAFALPSPHSPRFPPRL